MNLGELIPIIAIVSTAFVTFAIFQFIVRIKTIEAGKAAGAPQQDSTRLEAENRSLRQVIGRMEERLAVLERIATDPAHRTAREIEELR